MLIVSHITPAWACYFLGMCHHWLKRPVNELDSRLLLVLEKRTFKSLIFRKRRAWSPNELHIYVAEEELFVDVRRGFFSFFFIVSMDILSEINFMMKLHDDWANVA